MSSANEEHVRVTHVFFDVHDVLVDRERVGVAYAKNLGQIMAARYGSRPEAWAEANRRIVADWNSYYADLDLGQDDGMADMWEGLFRTTRALFRLTGTPEPDKAELTALARELPGLVACGDDLLYPDVAETLAALDDQGLILGVISHSLSNQIRASLALVLDHFKGTIWGADNAERFEKDVERYQLAARQAKVDPEQCLVIDDKREPLSHAQQAGMQTIRVSRQEPAADALPDLRGLVERLWVQEPDRSKR